MATFAYIGFLILPVIILFFIVLRYSMKTNDLPWNWPIIGMLPMILTHYHCLADRCTEFLESNDDTFIVKGLWFTNMDLIFTSDPVNVHHIFSNNFSMYPEGIGWKKRLDIFGNALFNSNFEEWKNHKIFFRGCLSHRRFHELLPKIFEDSMKKKLIPSLEHVSKQDIPVDFAKLEQRCVSTIRLCIGDNVFNHVIDEDSALRLWAKLKKIYLAKSLSNKLQLKQKLYRLKMEENEDLMKHMNEFDGIIDQLKKVDVKVEEEEKALLFLASLPDSYEVFVESLICGMDTITLEQAQATLMSREARKKSKEADRDPNGLALEIEANRRKSTEFVVTTDDLGSLLKIECEEPPNKDSALLCSSKHSGQKWKFKLHQPSRSLANGTCFQWGCSEYRQVHD
ncbi:PREDICTED: uncharacterized protein LOC108663030 [Theobroma cacao]|uniref:Uncharacterized protein LOC108663030 n=1 Tax=Theobroma cacao TaxID=3641 RepID=A0AB32WPJ8_THECC|nr:PREDICTED: uncharacterized protein LOC108663030 [Theobroma cacao]